MSVRYLEVVEDFFIERSLAMLGCVMIGVVRDDLGVLSIAIAVLGTPWRLEQLL